MSLDFNIVYQFKTSLDSHLLGRSFNGFSHEGLIEIPNVLHGLPHEVSFKRVSFFFAGRPVPDCEDAFASFRLFYVDLINSISLNGLSNNEEDPSVAVAFCYNYTPKNELSGRDSAQFKVISASELASWDNKGIILGRLCFESDKGVWWFYTDCVDFADKYFVENGLTDYMVASPPLKASKFHKINDEYQTHFFNPNVFVIKKYNSVIDSISLLLKRSPDGILVPVELDSSEGVDLSKIDHSSYIRDSGNEVIKEDDEDEVSHPIEGMFYALGYKSFVTDSDKVSLVDGGESYCVKFSVLGFGDSLEEAVKNSVDLDTGLFCPPMAVVKWSPFQSVITQFGVLSSVSSATNRTIVIDTESDFKENEEGEVVSGLNDTLYLPVPVRVESDHGWLSAGLHSLHSVVVSFIKVINSLINTKANLDSPIFTGDPTISPNKTRDALNNGSYLATEAQVYNVAQSVLTSSPCVISTTDLTDNVSSLVKGTFCFFQGVLGNMHIKRLYVGNNSNKASLVVSTETVSVFPDVGSSVTIQIFYSYDLASTQVMVGSYVTIFYAGSASYLSPTVLVAGYNLGSVPNLYGDVVPGAWQIQFVGNFPEGCALNCARTYAYVTRVS